MYLQAALSQVSGESCHNFHIALMMLASWAESMEHHAQLIHDGGLEPLVLSLQYLSPTAQLCGARGLACLAVHRHYRSAILQTNAPQSLAR